MPCRCDNRAFSLITARWAAVAATLVVGVAFGSLNKAHGQATNEPATATASEPQPKPTMKPADADGDGHITRAEWTKFVQSFRTLDTNDDNAVDLAELKTGGATSDDPIVLAAADFSGDGRLVRNEWTALGGAFKRIDTDKSGTLELAEFEAVVAAKKAAAEESKTFALRAGLWRGALVPSRGENPNSGRQIELLVVGNTIAGRDVGRTGDDANLGTGTFVASGKPNAGILDAQYSDGRICRGIFEMRGDSLYWCVSNRGEDRPDQFITANGFWLMVLKRVPDGK